MAQRVAVVTIVDVLGYDVEKHLHLATLVMNRGPTMVLILAVPAGRSANLGEEEVAHCTAMILRGDNKLFEMLKRVLAAEGFEEELVALPLELKTAGVLRPRVEQRKAIRNLEVEANEESARRG